MRLSFCWMAGLLSIAAACDDPVAPDKDVVMCRRAAHGVTAVQLPSLPNGGGGMARDINERGTIVGEANLVSSEIRAVTWQDGKIRDLGSAPGYVLGVARAVNASGVTVGLAVREGFLGHAFLWDGHVKHDLGVLPGDANSDAFAINAAGDIVGMSAAGSDNTAHAVLWHNGKPMSLGTLPGDDHSEALGIDAAGRVVGLSGWPSRPFVWEHGVMTELVDLNRPGVEFSVTRRGVVVAWKCPDADHGPDRKKIRRAGVIAYIPCPKESDDEMIDITDISASGQVVGMVWYMKDDDTRTFRPFVWSSGKRIPLPPVPGYTTTERAEAFAINNRGQIVGHSGAGPTLWTVR